MLIKQTPLSLPFKFNKEYPLSPGLTLFRSHSFLVRGSPVISTGGFFGSIALRQVLFLFIWMVKSSTLHELQRLLSFSSSFA